MRKIFLTLGVSALLFATSCGGGEKKAEGENPEEAVSESSDAPDAGGEEGGEVGVLAVGGLGSIPNPIVTAALIKESGAQYDKSALNTIDKRSNYSKSYEKSLNLGIYSADLAFANIYKQNQDAIDYLTAVKDLSTGLGIDKHFNFDKLKNLTESGADLDELLEVTLRSFEDANSALQNEDRSEAAIFILTGSWLEALYITTYAEKANSSQDLKLNIAEQKTEILPKIINVLKNNKDKSDHIPALLAQMQKIQAAFDPISIKYGDLDNKTTEGDEGVVVDQTSQDQLVGTDADFENLFNTIKAVRQEIVK